MQCEDCRYVCHKKCFNHVVTKCISKSNAETVGDYPFRRSRVLKEASATGQGRRKDQSSNSASLRAYLFPFAKLVLSLRHDPPPEQEESSQVLRMRLDSSHRMRASGARLLWHVDGNGQSTVGRSQVHQQASCSCCPWSSTSQFGFYARVVECSESDANRGQAASAVAVSFWTACSVSTYIQRWSRRACKPTSVRSSTSTAATDQHECLSSWLPRAATATAAASRCQISRWSTARTSFRPAPFHFTVSAICSPSVISKHQAFASNRREATAFSVLSASTHGSKTATAASLCSYATTASRAISTSSPATNSSRTSSSIRLHAYSASYAS